MGKFSLTLEEFKEFSQLTYQLLMDGLEEDHCWKCPMRTTSNRAYCRELHAWLKIQSALEYSITKYLSQNHSKEEVDIITGRFLEKRYKTVEKEEYQSFIFLIAPYDMDFNMEKGDGLVINPNPVKVKNGDIVFLPVEIPCPVSWFLKAGFLAGVPFKANKVIRSYHKGPSWFVELNNGEHVPIQLLMGVLAKTIEAFGEII